MNIEDQIRSKLTTAFSPELIEIKNESQLHQGHAGSPNSGESHFRVRVVSTEFEGKTRVERHRMINEVLSEELAGPVHALAISADTAVQN